MARRAERLSIPVIRVWNSQTQKSCHFYCFAQFGFIPGSEETLSQTVWMISYNVHTSYETGNVLRPCARLFAVGTSISFFVCKSMHCVQMRQRENCNRTICLQRKLLLKHRGINKNAYHGVIKRFSVYSFPSQKNA